MTRDAKFALMLNGRSVLQGTRGQVCSNDSTQHVNVMVRSGGINFKTGSRSQFVSCVQHSYCFVVGEA